MQAKLLEQQQRQAEEVERARAEQRSLREVAERQQAELPEPVAGLGAEMQVLRLCAGHEVEATLPVYGTPHVNVDTVDRVVGQISVHQQERYGAICAQVDKDDAVEDLQRKVAQIEASLRVSNESSQVILEQMQLITENLGSNAHLVSRQDDGEPFSQVRSSMADELEAIAAVATEAIAFSATIAQAVDLTASKLSEDEVLSLIRDHHYSAT
eukprot:COSAG01_NODE_29000_length_647_cov_6.239051_1_plen_211_part_01